MRADYRMTDFTSSQGVTMQLFHLVPSISHKIPTSIVMQAVRNASRFSKPKLTYFTSSISSVRKKEHVKYVCHSRWFYWVVFIFERGCRPSPCFFPNRRFRFNTGVEEMLVGPYLSSYFKIVLVSSF